MLNRQNSHHLVNAYRFLKLDAGAVTGTSTQIQMEEENTFKIWQDERKVDDCKC